MPWTESRSREEWLAEVQRRGARLRRRRRAAFGVVGALMLVLPVSVTASVFGSGPERAVEVFVAAPGGVSVPITTIPIEGGAGGLAVATPPEEPPPPAGAPSTSTTTEVHRRVVAINGVVEPAPPASLPPRSVPSPVDPVVSQPTTTTVPSAGVSTVTSAGAAQPVSSTTAPLTNSEPLPVCPAEVLQIDVVPTKATFALGETVRGVGFLQVRAAVATACRFPRPASFRIEEVGTGTILGSVPATSEPGSPVAVEPGRYEMGVSNFAWVPRECGGGLQTTTISSSACTQVPPGLYQAVIEWADGGPYRGWGEFRIGA